MHGHAPAQRFMWGSMRDPSVTQQKLKPGTPVEPKPPEGDAKRPS